MAKYSKIVFTAGPVLRVVDRREDGFQSAINVTELPTLDEYFAEGYELIKIVRHASAEGTGTMFVLGLPFQV